MPNLARRHLMAASLAPLLVAAAPPPAIRSRSGEPGMTPQVQPILVMAGEVSGTFARVASDLSVAVAAPGLRVMATLSHGSLDNIDGLIGIRGVDLGFVAADTLGYARDVLHRPNLSRIHYITKLYDNEVHVLARSPDIRTLADLAGKRVSTDVQGSGTAVTCSLVFSRLGLQVEIVNETPDRAVESLRRGDIDAMVYVIGKPGPLFRALPAQEFHLVEIPYAEALQTDYLPATFFPEDYPTLVPAAASVPSIAVGVVLACFGWDPGTDRYRGLTRFIEVFLKAFPSMRDNIPPFHPKWRDVNIGAEVPGWTRFAPVQGLLEASRKSAAGGDMDIDEALHALGVANPTAEDRGHMRVLLQHRP